MRVERGAMLTGMGLGVGLMYFLDPNNGRRRRALARDRVAHGARVASHAVDAARRDMANRASGAAARLGRKFDRRESAPDDVLVDRVRAALGRVVSHPHAIDVEASGGVVTLGGPILRKETKRLLKTVKRVGGVREVVSRLEEHKRPDSVPALQGGDTPPALRSALWQREWSPTARVVTGTTGVALASYGVARRDMPGTLLAIAGLGLAARAATNLELRRLTGIGGRRRGVDVQKAITINAPVEDVFAFWSEYSNFPRFLSRVLDVRPTGRPDQSHWTVVGPGGRPVEFDTEVSAMVPNEALGWRTVESSPVAHAGLVRFEPANGQTRVDIRMSYNPPGGWFGHEIASAFGVDPKSSLDADLARMKTLLETRRRASDAARPC